jgi:serine protease Do
VPELIEKGSVTRGYLGVQIMDAAEFADSLGLPDKNGAFVKEVQPNTPAARADLKTYDVIRRVNGKDITNAQDLVSTISAVSPGETVKLEIWRDDALVEVDVQIDEWSPDTTRVSRGESPVLGLSLRALAPEVADRLGLEKGTKGVLVTGVEPGSAADDAGLRQGDVITEVARKPVSSPEEFKSRIDREREPGKSIIIRFIRGSADNMTVIEVPKE